MVFATGNNVTFKGDMVRRGLTCELEAREERPELRAFKRNALKRARADRAYYIAAVLTIARAYLTAKAHPFAARSAPTTIGGRWSRSPLVWLGEPDPIAAWTRSARKIPSCPPSASSSTCGRTGCF